MSKPLILRVRKPWQSIRRRKVVENERLQILKMVEQGQISAEEGAKLLEALEEGIGKTQTTSQKGSQQARWLRIRVSNLASGGDKVNIAIPFRLVDLGLRIGARFAPNMEHSDVEKVVQAIREGTVGKVVDVQDIEGGERVEIFVE